MLEFIFVLGKCGGNGVYDWSRSCVFGCIFFVYKEGNFVGGSFKVFVYIGDLGLVMGYCCDCVS